MARGRGGSRASWGNMGGGYTPAASGGGGAPAWVPADAVIHIDLVGGTPQGRAWVAGTGEVAIETLLGEDLNATSAYGPTGYDADNITPNGYEISDDVIPAYIGAARTKIIVGCTIVRQLKQAQLGNLSNVIALVSADGENGLSVESDPDTLAGSTMDVKGVSWAGEASAVVTGGFVVGLDSVNRIAATITNTRIELAANGSSAAADSLDEVDRPPDALVAVVEAIGIFALQSITFYDPLPDTTGLSELSEVT